MSTMDFQGVLTEFGRTLNDETELQTFFSSLANNNEYQLHIFNAIQLDDPRTVPEKLHPLLKMLLVWYRSELHGKRHLILQFIPHLVAQSLVLRRSVPGKKLARELDAFFLAIYNREVSDANGVPLCDSFEVPSITHSSIYHDGSKVDPTGLDRADRDCSGLKINQTLYKQAITVNAQNRMVIAEALYRSFNSVMGELSKQALDQFVKLTVSLLQRGYIGPLHRHRVVLPSNILLELLNSAYFCIYNGHQSGGSRILDLIRQRGAAMGSAPVLLTVNSIRTLVLNSGPSQLPAASISTPSQIAKNLITNASFRAKKMGDDIPKVESDNSNAKDNQSITNNLKVLANMNSISEEVMEEILDKNVTKKDSTSSNPAPPTYAAATTTNSSHGVAGAAGAAMNKMMASKDKLRPKIPGFKKRNQEQPGGEGDKSSKESSRSGGGEHSSKKSEKRKDSLMLSGSGNSEILELAKMSSSRNEKKGASKMDSASSGQGSQSPSSSLFNGMQHQQQQQKHQQQHQQHQALQATDIDSMEKIEALIKNKKLPQETVTIHSPESGTTIF